MAPKATRPPVMNLGRCSAGTKSSKTFLATPRANSVWEGALTSGSGKGSLTLVATGAGLAVGLFEGALAYGL